MTSPVCGRLYRQCQTLSSDPERETRIRSVLERAGRRPPSPPPPSGPAQPTERPPPDPASEEAPRGGALPTFLDVYGEEGESDPRLATPLEAEDGDPAELVTRTDSLTDLTAEDGPPPAGQTAGPAADGRVKVKLEQEDRQETDLVAEQGVSQLADRPPKEEERMDVEEGSLEKTTSSSSSVKLKPGLPAASDGDRVKTETDDAVADGEPQDDAPGEQRTSSVAADDAVGKLDARLANKYQHLSESSFKQEFLANLIGNQDRDWDNLR